MTTPDAVPHPRDLLAAAQRDAAERDRLVSRRVAAESALRAARTAAEQARAHHAVEAADVDRLESMSPTRIWAALRGDRAERMDRERGEEQAAHYAVALAQARVDGAERELAAVESQLAAFRDVDTRRKSALAALEEWVRAHGGPAASDLDAILREQAAVAAERTEVAEAQSAATRADASLRAAHQELRGAGGWATYDTFLGGGMVADLVKRSKMDKASDLMRQADAHLRRLSTELGDLERTGVGELAIDSLTSTLDFWFDNIFSDWAVKNRIQDAGNRVEAARRRVQTVRDGLAAHAAGLEERAGLLEARREAMLGAA
jgi:hypothetical protein